jgi:high-affinity nickel permease
MGHFHFQGWFWDQVATLNDNFGTLGYFYCGTFRIELDRLDCFLQVASIRRAGTRS